MWRKKKENEGRETLRNWHQNFLSYFLSLIAVIWIRLPGYLTLQLIYQFGSVVPEISLLHQINKLFDFII